MVKQIKSFIILHTLTMMYNVFHDMNNNIFVALFLWCLESSCYVFCFFLFLLLIHVGLFAAAHEVNIEWVIVKGISHFSDDSNTPNESWKSFASIMAASLVSNMLSDPVVFKEWPHYEGI